MNMLPDEPLWLLQDGDQNTAHSTVVEAMQWLQEQHPTYTGWHIGPESIGERMISCSDGYWTVRRA